MPNTQPITVVILDSKDDEVLDDLDYEPLTYAFQGHLDELSAAAFTIAKLNEAGADPAYTWTSFQEEFHVYVSHLEAEKPR